MSSTSSSSSSSSLVLSSDISSARQFIFTEEEFEPSSGPAGSQQVFAGAEFVAKYRRVCSLESLREQLREYSDGLKHQLYDIINRDYKDFITIATKVS
jgi:hypothetical protein